ncbi:hypothetical protein MIR68_003911 [Amoeboaphelidium protococcarum]|nr:hypothetical protein MIR68_003911 [Amoeboaphelidium protococcarum]
MSDGVNYAKEHLEVAATERTFDLGYMRTCLQLITIGMFLLRLYGLTPALEKSCGLRRIGISLIVFAVITFIIGWFGRRWSLKKMSLKYGQSQQQDQSIGRQRQESAQIGSNRKAVRASQEGLVNDNDSDSQHDDDNNDDIEVQAEYSVKAGADEEIEMVDLSAAPRQVTLQQGPQQNNQQSDPQCDLPSRRQLIQELIDIEIYELECKSEDLLGQIYHVPIPAGDKQFASEFYQWRESLESPPTAQVFETAGLEVALIGTTAFLLSVIILIFTWQCS